MAFFKWTTNTRWDACTFTLRCLPPSWNWNLRIRAKKMNTGFERSHKHARGCAKVEEQYQVLRWPAEGNWPYASWDSLSWSRMILIDRQSRITISLMLRNWEDVESTRALLRLQGCQGLANRRLITLRWRVRVLWHCTRLNGKKMFTAHEEEEQKFCEESVNKKKAPVY